MRFILHSFALVLLIAATPSWADVVDIDNKTLERLLEDGVPVVDLRRADEWDATGVIPDSHLITFFDAKGDYDAPAWRRELEAIATRGEPVVLICRSGRRTELVSRWLDKSGEFPTIYNVSDGIVSWKSSGGQTVPAP